MIIYTVWHQKKFLIRSFSIRPRSKEFEKKISSFDRMKLLKKIIKTDKRGMICLQIDTLYTMAIIAGELRI